MRGGAEVIARLLGKTQQELVDSNRFIKNDLENQLIDPLLLDEKGLFFQSKNPLSFNPGYLSATAYVAGISARLGNGNIEIGIQIIKFLAEKLKNSERFTNELTKQLDGIIENSEGRKLVQMEGINELIKYSHPSLR